MFNENEIQEVIEVNPITLIQPHPAKAAKKEKKDKRNAEIEAKRKEREEKKEAKEAEKAKSKAPIDDDSRKDLSSLYVNQCQGTKLTPSRLIPEQREGKRISCNDASASNKRGAKRARYALAIACDLFSRQKSFNTIDLLTLIARESGQSIESLSLHYKAGSGLRNAIYELSKSPLVMLKKDDQGTFIDANGNTVDTYARAQLFTVDGRISLTSGQYVALHGHTYIAPDSTYLHRACTSLANDLTGQAWE